MPTPPPIPPPKQKSKSIDQVTTDILGMVLRSCGIVIDEDILDKIIDAVELIEEKGEEVSLKDINNLKSEWENHTEIKTRTGYKSKFQERLAEEMEKSR